MGTNSLLKLRKTDTCNYFIWLIKKWVYEEKKHVITNKSYMHLFSVGIHNFIINLVQNGSFIYVVSFVFDFI